MVPQSTDSKLHELRELDRRIHRLAAIKATLEWDQETNLPPAGVEERSEQLALLEGMIHELQTSPMIGPVSAELAETTLPTDEDRALVRLLRRDSDRA
jgi:carboxypeptidase Taq